MAEPKDEFKKLWLSFQQKIDLCSKTKTIKNTDATITQIEIKFYNPDLSAAQTLLITKSSDSDTIKITHTSETGKITNLPPIQKIKYSHRRYKLSCKYFVTAKIPNRISTKNIPNITKIIFEIFFQRFFKTFFTVNIQQKKSKSMAKTQKTKKFLLL